MHYISAARANGLKPAGVYQFGEDGKLIVRNGILRETLDDGKEYLFYYEDNVRQIGSGLLQLEDGSYIYVRSGANLAVGRYYVTKNNDLLPSGYYEFDENGKMIVPSAGESETGNPQPAETRGNADFMRRRRGMCRSANRRFPSIKQDHPQSPPLWGLRVQLC